MSRRDVGGPMNHTPDVVRLTRSRTAEIFAQLQQRVFQETDRVFAVLMAAQWIFGLAVAYWISPLTWAGTNSATHPHIIERRKTVIDHQVISDQLG